MRLTLGLGLLAALLACSGAGPGGPEAGAPAAVPEAISAGAPANEATPAAALPTNGGEPKPSSVPGVPGWLAQQAGGTEPYFTSLQANAPLVIPERIDLQLAAGTPLQAVGASGTQAVTFRGYESGRFGCDGGTELELVAFDGVATDPLVWLLPAGAPPARAVPVTIADTATERVWTIGPHLLGLTIEGPLRATLWAGSNRKPVDTINLGEDMMAGFEPEPMQVSQSLFVPQPSAAWDIGGTVVAVAPWDSLEGIHFTVFVFGDPVAQYEVASLYSCAF